jgi:tRNA A-37 threonylcarbamoyl transferase component Bud32
MLSQPDTEVARRDPEIPGLPLLLDVESFRKRINLARPALDITDLIANYVRYKPHTSCLVSYKAESRSGQLELYAKAIRSDSQSKLKKANHKINGNGAGESGVILDDQMVAIFFYPYDQEIKVLPRLADRHSRRELLARTLRSRAGLWDGELQILRYKPERRFVAQMVTRNGGGALLKAYAGGDYHLAQRGGKVLGSRGPLKIAQRLGRSNRHRLVILEWLSGQKLDEVMTGTDYSGAIIQNVGTALAELHSQRPRWLQTLNPELEMQSLKSMAGDLAFINPGLSARIDNLVELLVIDGLRPLSIASPIHNDFTTDQVLLEGEWVIFLDLDSAVIGDPSTDLSSFVARIMFDVIVGDASSSTASDVIGNFLDGYCRASKQSLSKTFNRLVSASLLRLAPHPFRYRLPAWPRLTQEIIEQAEVIAANRHSLIASIVQ